MSRKQYYTLDNGISVYAPITMMMVDGGRGIRAFVWLILYFITESLTRYMRI